MKKNRKNKKIVECVPYNKDEDLIPFTEPISIQNYSEINDFQQNEPDLTIFE